MSSSLLAFFPLWPSQNPDSSCCLFVDTCMYWLSQSGVVTQVGYAKASYVLSSSPRRFGLVRAFVRHLDVYLAIMAQTGSKRRGRGRRNIASHCISYLHNYTWLTHSVHIKRTNNNLNLDFGRVTKTHTCHHRWMCHLFLWPKSIHKLYNCQKG